MSAIATLAIEAACKNPETLGQTLSLRLKRCSCAEVKRTSIGCAEEVFTKAEKLGDYAGLHSEQVFRLAIEAWLIQQGKIHSETGKLLMPETTSNTRQELE